jgi:hypothetical protein
MWRHYNVILENKLILGKTLFSYFYFNFWNFKWLWRVKRLSFKKKYPFHPGAVHKPCGSCCSYVFYVHVSLPLTYLFHFDQLLIGPIKIVCLQQEKWISGGKTFDILCLFCRSYDLICAWKGWLYVSLWKLFGTPL